MIRYAMICDPGRYYPAPDKTKPVRVVLDDGRTLFFRLGEDCTIKNAYGRLIPMLVTEATGRKRKRGHEA